MANRVALYARVSTRDKDQTPETQLHALREYVASSGSRGKCAKKSSMSD